MVIHMADSGIAVVLLDIDPYHAMKTPLIEIALSQFLKRDQTNHSMNHKLSEKLHKLDPCQKLLTTKSDLTDIHLGSTMYWKYKANSVILLKSIEPYLNTLTYNSSAFLEDISFSLRGTSVLMVKNSLHFIFNIFSEILQDNQIMVSFDVEWLFTTVPVKDSVLVLLTKLGSDHETKPF